MLGITSNRETYQIGRWIRRLYGPKVTRFNSNYLGQGRLATTEDDEIADGERLPVAPRDYLTGGL
eukprot:scaffold70237_cov75-Cyclotella_meneghiniana.AAC.1